jgi:peptidoglycan/xylan/chitin deacetylase (PgdA/CDA1 family)
MIEAIFYVLYRSIHKNIRIDIVVSKKHFRLSNKQVWLLLLLILAMSVLSFLLHGYFFAASQATARTQPHRSGRSPAAARTETALGEERNSVQVFLTAFQKKDYAAIWGSLSPANQESWRNQNTFLQYMDKKYGNYSITGFTFSYQGLTASPVISRTTLNNLGRLPEYMISLTFNEQPLTALFQHDPLYVQQHGKGFLIASGGPTSRESPVFPVSSVPAHLYQVPVLMYHRVNALPLRSMYGSDFAYRLDYSLTVTPQEFADQMAALAAHGYHPITPVDLFNAYYYDVPLPLHPLLITLDDGRLSDFTNTPAVLLHYHFPAVYFICTQIIGTVQGKDNHNHYMSWSDVTQLSQEGMWIENHSLTDEVDMFSVPVAQTKGIIATASQTIQSHTGMPVQFLAYSGHWPTPDVYASDTALQPLYAGLRSEGIVGAFADQLDYSTTLQSTAPYQIPRVRVNPGESSAAFLASLQ